MARRKRLKKLPEKEALRWIEFLERKAEFQAAWLQIETSKLLSSTAIFMAVFLSVVFFVYDRTENPSLVFLVGLLLIVGWVCSTYWRGKKIKNIKIRIYAIGSFIKGIYKYDLDVAVDDVENKLDLLTEKGFVDEKEGRLK